MPALYSHMSTDRAKSNSMIVLILSTNILIAPGHCSKAGRIDHNQYMWNIVAFVATMYIAILTGEIFETLD